MNGERAHKVGGPAAAVARQHDSLEQKSQNPSHLKVGFLTADTPSPLTFSTPVFGSIPTSQGAPLSYAGTGTIPLKR